jgi:large subunit ribosomal protein L24
MPRSLFRKKPYKNPDGHQICRLKKGDRVQVMSGKNAKKIGLVKEIRTKDCQITVEGLNLVTPGKQKAQAKADPNSAKTKIEAPFSVSNVALVCPRCMAPTRVGYEILPPDETLGKKRKVRICRRCKGRVDD